MTLPCRVTPCPECGQTAEEQRARRATKAPPVCPHRPHCPIAGSMRFCDHCDALSVIMHGDGVYCAPCFIERVGLDALTTTEEEQPS